MALTEAQRKYQREYKRKWRAKNPEKVRQKSRDDQAKRKALGIHRFDVFKANLKKNYGLTPGGYAELLALQEGVCAGCLQRQKGKRLAVDHDHTTGHIRGLLCTDCNRGLGLLKDDAARLRRLADYLKSEP